MSGGSLAIRGYLVQTVVALLEALDTDKDWLSVTLEPDHVSEKIDILWQYPGKVKAVQVKSSVNPFEDAAVKGWARDLEASRDADEYQLILVGTPSKPAVAKARYLGKVAVPAPKNLDLTAFRQQTAHLLDRFMAAEAIPTGGADCREMLADALVGKLTTLAAKAQPFSRSELIALLKTWIAEAPKDGPLFPIFDCPPRNPWFTGRDNEIVELRQRLCQTGEAAIGQAITGLGGIGKTQTAIEYAHRHRDQYDAVFWISAATDLDLMTSYRAVANLLRLPHDVNAPNSVQAVVKHWLENVDRRCWLLVFDNADDPPLLKPYLPGRASNGHILATSRVRLDVVGIPSALSIQKLPVKDSTQFLLDRAGRAPGGAVERQAAGELAGELDGLPLALEQAAAYVAAMHVTYGQYLETYKRQKLGLLERHGPETGAYPATVATTWLINFEQVEAESRAAADLLRLSALLDPDEIPFDLLTKGANELGEPLCAAIKPSDPLTVNEVLEPLARFSLARVDPERRTYSVHRLVQEVVKDAMGDANRRAWADRVVRAINAAFPSFEVSDWPACQLLVPQAMASSRLIKEFGLMSIEAARLLNQAGCYLRVRGQLGLAEPLFRQTIEISRHVLGENHPDFATSLNNLAAVYESTGRYSEAELLYQEAMNIRRQVLGERHPAFGASLNNLAGLYHATGRYQEAEPLFRKALELNRESLGEQHPDYASSLNNLAGLCDSMGRYSEAELLYQQAMEIRREILGEQHPDFAASLNNLAALYCATHRYKKAEPLYRQAIDIGRKTLGEQHPDFATGLNNLALLYHSMCRFREAELLHQRAMEIRRQVQGEQHPAFAASLNNLAGLCYSMHRYEEAEVHCRHALQILLEVLGPQHPNTKTCQVSYDALRRKLTSSPSDD